MIVIYLDRVVSKQSNIPRYSPEMPCFISAHTTTCHTASLKFIRNDEYFGGDCAKTVCAISGEGLVISQKAMGQRSHNWSLPCFIIRCVQLYIYTVHSAALPVEFPSNAVYTWYDNHPVVVYNRRRLEFPCWKLHETAVFGRCIHSIMKQVS